MAGLPARQAPKDAVHARHARLAGGRTERLRRGRNSRWLPRRQRENILEHVLDTAGNQPFAKITTATHHGRARLARQYPPAQARKFLDAMRGLFRWAVKVRLVKI